MYKAYRIGSGAIKKTLAEEGLTPENVDAAIQEMTEVMHSFKNIGLKMNKK